SRRGRVVLFGGLDSTGFRGDTWEFDGSTWQKLSDSGPAPRAAFGMAYDSARGRTVLFGGGRDFADPVYTDTWEWDGRAWTRVATSGPAGSIFLKMSYDAHRRRVVAFGGRGGGGETWEWDGRVWSRVSTSGPPPRDHHAMTYDARRQRVVIFGGGRQLPNGDFPRDTTGAWLRDLWAGTARRGRSSRRMDRRRAADSRVSPTIRTATASCCSAAGISPGRGNGMDAAGCRSAIRRSSAAN